MTVKRLRLALLALTVSLATQSCITYEDVDVQSIEDVRVENVLNKNEALKIMLDVKIDNPNTYAVKMKKADLNLYVGGKDLGKVYLDQKIKVPKKSVSVQTVVITPESRDILVSALGGILGAMQGGDVKVKLKGRVKGGALGISKWFNIDHSEEINVKEMMGSFGGLGGGG